jgi:outer membrane protein insertion porin family
MEGGWASTAQIDLSKVRLDRLGYFSSVDVETPDVPGTDDQIDVNFTVEEQPSGSISATVGYEEASARPRRR